MSEIEDLAQLDAGRRWTVPPNLGRLERVHPELAHLKRSWPAA